MATEHHPGCASLDRLPDPGPEGEGTFDERGRYQPVCDCGASSAAQGRGVRALVTAYWPHRDTLHGRHMLRRIFKELRRG